MSQLRGFLTGSKEAKKYLKKFPSLKNDKFIAADGLLTETQGKHSEGTGVHAHFIKHFKMEKFKKILIKQLVFLPLLGLIAFIIGAIANEINRSTYKEVSSEAFTEIAIKNKITNFSCQGYGYKMKTLKGEKYRHKFMSYEESEKFKNKIMANFDKYGESHGPFYETLIILIVILFTGILFLNFIISWFVTLYDLLKSEFEENHNKWIWFFSLILLPFITPFFYLAISKNQKRKSDIL